MLETILFLSSLLGFYLFICLSAWWITRVSTKLEMEIWGELE